jgi:hypothetical protein
MAMLGESHHQKTVQQAAERTRTNAREQQLEPARAGFGGESHQ